jgi:ribosome maturation factor RimP
LFAVIPGSGMVDPLEREIEAHVAGLGFELVEMERAGSKARPILRLRVDRPDSEPGRGVSLEDCRVVSRALESLLEESRQVPERYVLEVSSPGVERPLVRPRDYVRFRGSEVAVLGRTELRPGHKRVEGELLGLQGAAGEERVRLRTKDGAELEIPLDATKKVHLIYRWGGAGGEK